MSIALFRRSNSVVGLDLGSSAFKAVELKQTGSRYKVVAFGAEPVPPGCIVDGAILDSAAVAAVIRRLFDTRRIKTQSIATALSGTSVIVKKITIPQMPDAELAASIHWQAEQYIPFEITDVNLDYQILAPSAAAARDTMEVLLVAAKNDSIADYTGAISAGGRTAVVVDVDAFALQNAYEANYGVDPDAVVVLVNAGASATTINIVSDGQSVFTRGLSIGGNAYNEALQQELSLDFATAEQLKRGQTVEGTSVEEARPTLRAVTESVMLEIQKTLDYYKATAASDRLDRIAVSGGASRAEGFTDLLAERFALPVAPLDPFRQIAFDPSKFKVDLAEVAPAAAVAVGLALRRAGDR